MRILQWKHLTFVAEKGISVHVTHSKTGEKTIGVNAKPNNPLDIVAPLKAWRERLGAGAEDYLFRGLDRHREATDAPIGTKLMTIYVKRGCSLIGYDDVTDFAPHSLRSGCITSHSLAGASVTQLLALSKHKNLSSLQRYVKVGDFDHGL